MSSPTMFRQTCYCLAFLVSGLAMPCLALGQTSGTSGSSGSSGICFPVAGVMLDAGAVVDENGVVSTVVHQDPGGRLRQARMANAKAHLNPDVVRRSALRMVSLTRLEKAVATRLAAGRALTDEMKYLAGLNRIQYAFFFPDSGDVVVAGPAEGWFEDLAGRVIGLSTAQPVLELQDLVVALRNYPPGKQGGDAIGCSIDPTQEGLVRMQNFLREITPKATPNDAQAIVDGLEESLGLQKVRVMGIPANTHFALVMIEADYRMKLIGIGKEDYEHFPQQSPVKLKSFVSLADGAAMSRNAMCRWWFVPNYEAVRMSKDGLAMELVGRGVKLVGEDEVVGANGQRSAAGRTSGATKRFTKGFTDKYPKLAQVVPVYAQLRNLVDMAVVAAFFQRHNYYEKAAWTLPVFGDEEQFPVQVYQTPTEVATAANAYWKNGRLLTPVGGGVTMRGELALDEGKLLPDEGGKVDEARQATQLDHLHAGQWWWDAEE